MTWQYFKDEEVKGLLDDVVYKLERARALFDAPIIITSGYRDPVRNDEVGGVKDSAHTQGKAVDIQCNDLGLQRKLIWALTIAGFRRIGAYDKHIHCDVSDDKPTPCFWTGVSH